MSYFVRIGDATGTRRGLLESSKDLLHILKGYYELLEIRERKKEVADELRHAMAELIRLSEELERLLPEKSLKEIEHLLPKASKGGKAPKGGKKGAKPENEAAVPPQPKKTPAEKEAEKKQQDLERLEKALSNINERLSKL